RQVTDGEGFRVRQDEMIVGRVLFDRVDAARVREIGRLDGDGSRAGADVPNNVTWLNVELRQRERAHLRLGDQAALRPALAEDIVRVAKAAQPTRTARQVRASRFALQDHDVQRRKLHRLDFGQLALRHALVGSADIFAYIGAKVIQTLSEQSPRDYRRAVLLRGEKADGLGRANAIENRI